MLFRVWESINSYMYDERMLHFLSELSEMHVASEVSNPRGVQEIPDDERSEDEGRFDWSQTSLPDHGVWPGIYKDVGIFSDHEWNFLMCKCLASMGKLRLVVTRIATLMNGIFRNTFSGWWLPDHRPIG